MRTISEPGLYYDVKPADYHADCCPTPSLSSGVAGTLVAQTPAHAYLEHVRLGGHKSEPTPAMDLGSYIHGLIADDVSEFEIGNYDNFTTKAAKEWRDGVKSNGQRPILEKTADRAKRCADALRAKAAAGVSNSPFTAGKSEVTAIWQEDDFWFRARYDRLILDENGFADIWDWKTTSSVTDDAIQRAIIDHGYHIQAAHYMRGLSVLAPRFAGRTSFIFAFVETEPPFAVRRVCLSEGFLSLGQALLSRAIDRWKHCLTTGIWPDDSTQTLTLEPPAWYSMRIMEAAA